uniref:Anaphase-promoting complex subunit 4 WD40 domain-containing protein n=1 Tax=Aureoumbra lagunensis TaxID=44058 RepID=A0A7S3NJ16_9STRA|mmetsp:Transcript_11815/g.17670  ORF Transcript_11815/g.17670 Transcript_11815/m.17670 type:complete len:362 (+) Transcript_11815:44-1129(+)
MVVQKQLMKRLPKELWRRILTFGFAVEIGNVRKTSKFGYSITMDLLSGRFAIGIDKKVVTVDAESGKILCIFTAHRDKILHCGFSYSGERIITSSCDKKCRIWDAEGYLHLSLGHYGTVFAGTYSNDDKQIVTTSYDTYIRFWDICKGQLMTTLAGHTSAVTCCCFSHDGTMLLTGSYDQTAIIWDLTERKNDKFSYKRVLKGHTYWINSVNFAADDSLIVTGSSDHTAKTWDVHSGNVRNTFVGHSEWIWTSSFSSDAKRIVTSSIDRSARIWDAHSANLIHILQHEAEVSSSSFTSDDLRIITGASDNRIIIWDSYAATILYSITFRQAPNNSFIFCSFTPTLPPLGDSCDNEEPPSLE